MSTDWYTKLVLTLLAASAAVLAAQALQSEPAASDARFRIQAVPMARMLIRFDTESGKAWTAPLNRPDAWVEIAESKTDTLDDISESVEKEKAAAAAEAPKPERGEKRTLQAPRKREASAQPPTPPES